MAQEIYHRSEWGNPNEQWGNVYLNADLTNELYKRASEYENSWVTDQLLNGVGTKPSIILTPTAYEDGVLNSVKPNKTLGSELVTNGTFDTDSDWTKQTGWAISGGVANYDFTSDAKYIRQTLLNGGFVSGKTYRINFEITTGTAYMYINSNGGSLISLNTYSVGSYSLYTTASANGSDLLIYGRNTGGTAFSIDNVSVKEIIDADFDFTRGSSATRVNELGLVQDVTETNLPRINYTDGKGSLLLEPQSTNLVTYSEDFSEWTRNTTNIDTPSNVTQTNPSGGSESGFININNGVSATKFIYKSISTTSSIHTQSVFFKYHSRQWVQLLSGGTTHYANFDIQNGVVGNVLGCTATIEDYGSGWYKCTATLSSASTPTNMVIAVLDDDATSRLPNSTGTGSYYVWGAQVEALSYATSYIPTNGSTVTRLADVCNNSGSSDLINSTEGVLYAEVSALADDLTNRSISISDGSTNNRVNILYSNSTNQIRVIVVVGGSTKFDQNYNVTSITDIHKIAVKYKADDFALWVDGVERLTDTSGTIFTQDTLNELAFNIGGGILPFYGNVKCLAVFKEALSDTELQKLTTI